MMDRNEWTWTAYCKRNAKYLLIASVGFLGMWNTVAIGEWLYALFGAELHGYGEAQQRWHRVIGAAITAVFSIGFMADAFKTIYYKKHPEEAQKLKQGLRAYDKLKE